MSRTLWITLGLSTLFIFLLGAFLGLSDQEAYYWLWSRSLDLCYLEHPGLQAWITRLLTEILGDGAWVVRLPASTFGRLLGFYFIFRWAQLRFNKEVAETLCYCLLGSFFVSATALIALPDAFLFPLYGLLLWQTEKRNYLRVGLVLGLCALAKWTAVFFIPGILGVIFWDPSKKFKQKLLIATGVGVLALALQAPTLYWNSIHDFASFRFHLIARHPNFSWEFLKTLQNFVAFSASQIVLGGLSFVALFLVFIKNKKGREPVNASPLWPWIIPAFGIVGFSALRGELRFYWTAPALIPLAAFLINKLYFGSSNPKILLSKLNIYSQVSLAANLAMTAVALLLPVGEYLRPIVEKYRSFDMRMSPRGDIEGWKEVISVIQNEGINPYATEYALAGSNFRISAQLAWATQTQDVGKIYVGGPSLHQLHFWHEHRKAFPATKALMFADNRYRDKHLLQENCEHLLTWKTFEYKLQGKTIKTIDWAECQRFVKPI